MSRQESIRNKKINFKLLEELFEKTQNQPVVKLFDKLAGTHEENRRKDEKKIEVIFYLTFFKVIKL